ncbi:hypothetical protein [Candidatus Poriferisodalis sp.]|uniref:hypothetical protein n=1 Tax=Candidatus Poriferisodalis sp. TaxID=3101277 RepID=UPI003B02DC12
MTRAFAGSGAVRRDSRAGQSTLDWLLIVGAIAAIAATTALVAQRVFDEGAEVERPEEARRALLLEADILAAEYEDEASDALWRFCNPKQAKYTDPNPNSIVRDPAEDGRPCDGVPTDDTMPSDLGPMQKCKELADPDGPYSSVVENAQWEEPDLTLKQRFERERDRLEWEDLEREDLAWEDKGPSMSPVRARCRLTKR